MSDVNIYYNPERHGLRQLGSVDWLNAPYEFDLTVVWFDPESNQVYMADDSGCSCPTPFDRYASRHELTEVLSLGQLIRHLNQRTGDVSGWRGSRSSTADQRVRLIETYREVRP